MGDSMEEKLDEDFLFYLTFTKTFFRNLLDKQDIELCQAWLKKLCSDEAKGVTAKRSRNIYLSRLVLAMQEGKLQHPFLLPPPNTLCPPQAVFGPPDQLNEEAPRWLEDAAEAESGWGVDLCRATRDGRTYLATRNLGERGAFGCMAINTAAQPQWRTATGCADTPTGPCRMCPAPGAGANVRLAGGGGARKVPVRLAGGSDTLASATDALRLDAFASPPPSAPPPTSPPPPLRPAAGARSPQHQRSTPEAARPRTASDRRRRPDSASSSRPLSAETAWRVRKCEGASFYTGDLEEGFVGRGDYLHDNAPAAAAPSPPPLLPSSPVTRPSLPRATYRCHSQSPPRGLYRRPGGAAMERGHLGTGMAGSSAGAYGEGAYGEGWLTWRDLEHKTSTPTPAPPPGHGHAFEGASQHPIPTPAGPLKVLDNIRHMYATRPAPDDRIKVLEFYHMLIENVDAVWNGTADPIPEVANLLKKIEQGLKGVLPPLNNEQHSKAILTILREKLVRRIEEVGKRERKLESAEKILTKPPEEAVQAKLNIPTPLSNVLWNEAIDQTPRRQNLIKLQGMYDEALVGKFVELLASEKGKIISNYQKQYETAVQTMKQKLQEKISDVVNAYVAAREEWENMSALLEQVQNAQIKAALHTTEVSSEQQNLYFKQLLIQIRESQQQYEKEIQRGEDLRMLLMAEHQSSHLMKLIAGNNLQQLHNDHSELCDTIHQLVTEIKNQHQRIDELQNLIDKLGNHT